MAEATEGLLEECAVLGGECPLPPGASLVGVTMIGSLGGAWLFEMLATKLGNGYGPF